MSHPFDNRKLFVATMHKKEVVIGPLFEKEFDCKIVTSNDFNTDAFGTFSSEVKRASTQHETLKKKIEAAHKKFGYDLIVASEGSFNPDPNTFGLLYSNVEMVMIRDYKNDFEISGIYKTTDTNHNNTKVKTIRDAEVFLENIDLSKHGVIVSYRSLKTLRTIFHKELKTKNDVLEFVENILKSHWYVDVRLFSDMRAYRNSTRMKYVGKATENLIENSLSLCPVCTAPGFVITSFVEGALCLTCGEQTNIPVRQIRVCKKCSHKTSEAYAGREIDQTATFGCAKCNP